jgi:hypothetical protein
MLGGDRYGGRSTENDHYRLASDCEGQEEEEEEEEEDSGCDAADTYTDSSSSPTTTTTTTLCSPLTSAREPERYHNLHNFVDMMRGRRDHVRTHDVSNEGEDFLEAIIGFFSSPFVSMWDTIHP